jgi:hypothetical protein
MMERSLGVEGVGKPESGYQTKRVECTRAVGFARRARTEVRSNNLRSQLVTVRCRSRTEAAGEPTFYNGVGALVKGRLVR